MPYKGLALAEAIYGDIALRQSGDIDLLIRAVDLSRVRRGCGRISDTHLTRSLSEAEERTYLKSGYECAFDGPAGRNLLEVQWAIQPRFYAVDFDMEGMFERAVVVPVAGHPDEDTVGGRLVPRLSLHAAKHVWGRLIWLCDLARLMKLPDAELEADCDLKRQNSGTVRILRVALLLG